MAESMEAKGRRLFQAKKYKEAAETYQALAREEPSQPKWYTNAAKCLYQMGRHDKAIKLCKQAIAVDPAWERGYQCQGEALLAKGESYEAVRVPEDELVIWR